MSDKFKSDELAPEKKQYDCCELKALTLRDVKERGPRDIFRLYGKLVKYMLNTPGGIRREDAEWVAKKVAEEERINIERTGLYAMLYNDLRRLGIVTVGKGNWVGEGRLTLLGEWLKRCRHLDEETLGALLFLLCVVKDWPLAEEEAGVCIKARERLPRDYLKAAAERVEELLIDCLPYGADISRLVALREETRVH